MEILCHKEIGTKMVPDQRQFPNALLCAGILRSWVLQCLSSRTLALGRILFSLVFLCSGTVLYHAVLDLDELDSRSQINLILTIPKNSKFSIQ